MNTSFAALRGGDKAFGTALQEVRHGAAIA
jgi:hypothetical protein